jgi:hypothetical protein
MFHRNTQQKPFYGTAIAAALALSVTVVFTVLADALTGMQSFL